MEEVFTTPEPCLCGFCVENCTGLDGCSGNCQFESAVNADCTASSAGRQKPTSLLVYVPCQYETLDIIIGTKCDRFNLTRSPEGFFNITLPDLSLQLPNGSWPVPEFPEGFSCDGDPGGRTLTSQVFFYGYGDPEYNETVYYPSRFEGDMLKPISSQDPDTGEWRWEIHTSCSYELRLNQTWGPQDDMIIGGFCIRQQQSGVSGACGYSEELDPYQCSAAPSSQPSTSGKPSYRPSSEPTGMPSENPSTSRQPSGEPSGDPSLHPSALPSSEPTEGTNEPSLQPSDAPSTPPSEEPSLQPSGEPTLEPSREPSGTPSTEPTFLPSARPSSIPSISSAPI